MCLLGMVRAILSGHRATAELPAVAGAGLRHRVIAGGGRGAADVPAQSIPPTATLFDIAHIFLTRSYRKLPVVDRDGRVIGQVSRRDILVAIESARDNPRR